MSKRKTVKRSEKPKGKSKYARKVTRRRKAALALGFEANTPWPVIWATTASTD